MTDLLDVAMRVCDLYDDSEQARADMRANVLATPPHLHADLLAHFTTLLPRPGEPIEAGGGVEVWDDG